MRPVRLEIDGFTSFRNPQEIDFSELDLFAITGPTGSGKSSILDAVTLALYGRVPRASKHEQKELISLGASQAKVQLDFEVNGARYRVARRVPRAGAQSATFERIDGDEAISEVDSARVTEANARIEEVVGLDFDAFTKTVLLPQGAFQEFLNGEKDERRKILIRLLDLERFERAGKRAREIASELRHRIESTEAVLAQQYEGVTEEAAEEKEEEAQVAEKHAVDLDGVCRRAGELWSSREAVGRRLADLEAVKDNLGEQERRLEKVRRQWSALEVEDRKTTCSLEKALKGKEKAEKELATAKEVWTKTAGETGPEGTLAGLAKEAEALRQCTVEIQGGSEALVRDAEQRDAHREERTALATQLEAGESEEATATGARDAARRDLQIEREVLAVAKQAADLKGQLEGARAELEMVQGEVTDAEAGDREAQDELGRARAELEALETEHQGAALRAHLHTGDDCPVCGTAIGELPETDPDTEARLRGAARSRDSAEAAAKDASRLLTRAQTRHATLERQVGELGKKLDALGEAPSLADAEKRVADREREERQAEKRLKDAGAAARKLRVRLAEFDTRIAGLEAALDGGRSRLEQARKREDKARTQLVVVLGDPLPAAVEEEIAARQERLRAASEVRDAAESAYAEAADAHDAVVEARRTFEHARADLDAGLSRERALLGERRLALKKLAAGDVPDLAIADEDDRGAALDGLEESVQGLRESAGAEAERIGEELDALDETLRGLAEAAGFEREKVAPETAVQLLESAARGARRTADRMATQAEALRKSLANKEKTLTELEDKRASMELYRKVATELRQDQFIAFLLDESFRDLALRASNELLTISNGGYSLAASKDSFEVIDHANADERRSVVTLSGGETFLASLALALALAQGIADIAGHSAAARLEAMFIDEGFGTLDPTAFDLAVDALERLREGERMVGVITHVLALAERIPAGIAVEKRSSGSVVELR